MCVCVCVSVSVCGCVYAIDSLTAGPIKKMFLLGPVTFAQRVCMGTFLWPKVAQKLPKKGKFPFSFIVGGHPD